MDYERQYLNLPEEEISLSSFPGLWSRQSDKWRRSAKIAAVIAVVLALLLCAVALMHTSSNDLGITESVAGSALLFRQNLKNKQSMAVCKDPDFSKNTLKLAYEETIFGLLNDTRDERKFEASGVRYHNGTFWVVSDNSWALGKFSRNLLPFSPENMQVGEAKRKGFADSQWEGLVFDDKRGVILTMREEVPIKDLKQLGIYIPPSHDDQAGYRSVIQEISLSSDGFNYSVVQECVASFHFYFENKGFEGATGLRDRNGELYLLALCEGNQCKGGESGSERGNGILILMKKRQQGENCYWETVKMVRIPKSAYFADYSAVAVKGATIAIVSQEDSAVWFGKISLRNGFLDPKSFELDDSNSKIFNFPRDSECQHIYCNVEGIDFISEHLFVAVSDKMKSKGRQSFRCLQKDQSLHIFAKP